MGEPHKSKLTDYLIEALAKSHTEEGRQELLEARAILDAEAQRKLQEAAQREKQPLEAAEAGTTAQTPPEDGQEPPEVRPERRIDPIFPVVQSVREPPEREAGRLAFGGIIEDRKSLPAQLPLLPTPEGPRVPLLELSDWRGVPTMAKGRGAPLDLRLAVGACVLTPHAARAARGRLVVTVRELRDFLFPNGWERRRDWPRIREALFRARGLCDPGRAGQLAPLCATTGARGRRGARRPGADRRRAPPWIGTRPRDRPERAGAPRGGVCATLPGVHRGEEGANPGEERALTGGRKGANRGKKTP